MARTSAYANGTLVAQIMTAIQHSNRGHERIQTNWTCCIHNYYSERATMFEKPRGTKVVASILG